MAKCHPNCLYLPRTCFIRYRETIAAAVQCFFKVVEISPHNAIAWGLLGRCYMATNQYTDAWEAYNKYVFLYDIQMSTGHCSYILHTLLPFIICIHHTWCIIYIQSDQHESQRPAHLELLGRAVLCIWTVPRVLGHAEQSSVLRSYAS